MPTDARDDAPVPLDIEIRTAPGVDPPVDVQWIERHARAAADTLAREHALRIRRLHVLIVDDARMAHLHERHSGDAATTDVLTFDLREDHAAPIEADIVVCADEARRRAAEFGHTTERELLLYCLHGLLHCAGFDDHDEPGWTAMHAMEDQVLASIGVGATFARAHPTRERSP